MGGIIEELDTKDRQLASLNVVNKDLNRKYNDCLVSFIMVESADKAVSRDLDAAWGAGR